jgi:uncharacterized protein (DUF1800 family)
MVLFRAQIAVSGLSATYHRYRHVITLLASFLLASGAALHAQTSPTIAITGPNQARLGVSVQYSALIAGVSSSAVAWSVNGVANGNSSTGSISASGLYTPASTLFAGHSVTVSVATQSAPVSSVSLTVKILSVLPAFTSVTASASAPGIFSLDLHGSGFVPGSQVQVLGSSPPTTFISSTELLANVSIPVGTLTIKVGVLNPNAGQSVTQQITLPPPLLASLTQATRLLDQTSFGPTLASVQTVQQVGMTGYLNQQFATPATLMPAIPNPPVALCPDATYRCARNYFWKNALTGNDQLRQRVGFALSEIFVVSTAEVNARSIPSYYNLLANDAFGNFRQIMNDVTTSAAMGAYLNMLNSGVAPAGQIANENYARELMQLFTTGIYILNPDGSLQLSAQGRPQPVYSEDQVHAYARALTGWTYATATGDPAPTIPNGWPNYDMPMRAIAYYHDTSSKSLLNGVTLPAGQTAEQDLSGVLDSIFNHPNVGPFVGRQLIQHLVTSNPSPAYVARIAAVFANDGSGVRGNMRAVITAILADAEARAGDTNAAFDGGHLREPILYFTGILRALQFTNVDPQGRYDNAGTYTGPLGQVPFTAPSVFNFFPPTYMIPGSGNNAPEFAQENTAASTLRLTLADSIVRNHLTSFSIDMSPASALGQIASATGNAGVDAANLVCTLSILFTHNQMPAPMQSAITAQAASLSDIGQRVRYATWLVISSNAYKIEH